MTNYNHQVDNRGGIIVAVNDSVEILSTNNEELDGQHGIITGILSGQHGTEVKVLLENGTETWIDAEEVILF
ncbi:hypothetical protein P4310_30870 [Bacillus thuringiensis]|uniref:hypothetical protein n=1 Tax=Bacillus thuringiensis TaxID=1428 RepID=UPI000A36CB7E|nr:hypothetical protein [Bacillus thuringiensis]MCU4984478.1 hypothetical protein [Bacillus cereus]MED3069789.1 hypothetical protein [Bacillus thuringiensis]OUB31606.1 hypothetical protein BK737_15590 [Bacillus thuringiensis serovar palmanyolensis]